MNYVHPEHAAPQRKKSKAPWIILAIGLIILACVGGSVLLLAGLGKAGEEAVKQIDKEVAAQADAKKADVKILSCKATDFGGFEAEVEIKNSSTEAQTYWVQIDLFSADGKTRRGEGHAIVNSLKPGATAKEKAMGTGDMKKGDKCALGDVN